MTHDATPLLAIRPVSIQLADAPIHNQLNSLAALKSAQVSTGLAQWIYEAEERLGQESRQRNILLFALLGINTIVTAAPPGKATNLAEYAELLLNVDAITFRDRCLATMQADPLPSLAKFAGEVPPPLADPLADEAAFVQHFRAWGGYGDTNQWSQIYCWLQSPATLQLTIASHLQTMWHDLLAAEWSNIQPQLRSSIAYLKRIDIDGLTGVAALSRISGRNVAAILSAADLDQFSEIIAVPSLHNGPYITLIPVGDSLYFIFGARFPQEMAPLPAHTDIALNRLKALSDETRLGILLALQAEGEMSTGAIMTRFSLSKSAASRHLRFLLATELVTFERVDKTKKRYRLNRGAMAAIIAFMQQNFA